MSSNGRIVHSDLDHFMAIMPPDIKAAIMAQDGLESNLIEVVLDLGRTPQARLITGDIALGDAPVTQELLDHVEHSIGKFGDDNRAGIERTLHRISALKNRAGGIVGLTCRIGRAVHGSVELVRDMIERGNSVLLLGRPGIGKTTMLREVARALADEHRKRVIIVDTSNEIAGDGDIPHPAIGRARRMQVPQTELQHRLMVEAVENHTPEVIIIDEMSMEQEAAAARTIAERGVQLVATAHGNSLTNVLSNPTLSDLVGGINTVTLGDEEAQRRGTQKTVLERKHAPTFDSVVEIIRTNSVLVHLDVASAVDNLLLGKPITAAVRTLDGDDGAISVGEQQVKPDAAFMPRQEEVRGGGHHRYHHHGNGRGGRRRYGGTVHHYEDQPPRTETTRNAIKVFAFGIGKPKLVKAGGLADIPVQMVDNVGYADVFVTTKTHYKRCRGQIKEAELNGVPVHILRRASEDRISQFLYRLVRRGGGNGAGRPEAWEVDMALQEAREAVNKIINGGNAKVSLTPNTAAIRRAQHQLARQFDLNSASDGVEPERRVTLYAS